MRFDVTAEQREALIKRMGLDKPVVERYADWAAGAIRGDLGTSLLSDEPVAQRIGERLPNTLTLAGAALIVSIAIGIPIGLIQALRRGSALDHLLSFYSAIGLAVPVFWLGIVLILIFAVSLGWLPSAGVTGISDDTLVERLRHLALPTVALATTTLPTIVRFMRSAALEVLHEDYIRTAASKGLAPRVVVTRHALRNALIPVVSAVGALVPRLLGGTVVTESVFSWPGMGRLALEAAQGRDYPLITGITVVVAGIAVATTLLVDLAYTRIDPRLRAS
jgi:peptide/nickel transport system permease protein